MHLSSQFRSLLAQLILRIALPLALVMFGMIAAGWLAYQRGVTSLVLDRDRQLATLSALRVSEALEANARVLEALASNPDLLSRSGQVRSAALSDASGSLEIFNAGVIVVSAEGEVLTVAPDQPAPVAARVDSQAYFQSVRARRAPAFSDVLSDVRSQADMIIIAVPILDEQDSFAGALLGAIHLQDTPLGEPVRRLNVGDEGFAYLVDGLGRVIFHPEPENIGADFTSRPFVTRVIAGESGGMLWNSPSGDLLVVGYAPVEIAGWGLTVREPWSAVAAPAQSYGLIFVLAGLGFVSVAAYVLWWGLRRIAAPVRLLAAQTARLAASDTLEPIAASGILEIDALQRAFSQMAAQIASYRAGLRRYAGAITQSQEDERRRIARDLHDETAQSLLALARRLELYPSEAGEPARQTWLAELRAMVTATLHGVRQISQDLRPLMLEDLGLVPALHTLVRVAREAGADSLNVRLVAPSPPGDLSPEQELALYRIAQEALNNVRRHAGAANVLVELKVEPGAVHLDIGDDGQGFEVPVSLAVLAQRGSFGLMGIQERVWAAGGSLLIKSKPGGGTCLHITLPVDGRTPGLPVRQHANQA